MSRPNMGDFEFSGIGVESLVKGDRVMVHGDDFLDGKARRGTIISVFVVPGSTYVDVQLRVDGPEQLIRRLGRRSVRPLDAIELLAELA